jgi:excisionase family DNA binding protein
MSPTRTKPKTRTASPNRQLDLAALEAMPPSALLTIPEAAQYLSVTPRWMRRAVTMRLFDTVRVGRLVRVPKSALDSYRQSQTIPASGEVA